MNEKSTPPASAPELNIEIDDAVAQGIYANLAIVTHSESEFVLDFVFHSLQPPKAKVRARILTSPVHMKRLAAALAENVARYESRFGPLKAPGAASDAPRVGFF
jgi:hypothetical protein